MSIQNNLKKVLESIPQNVDLVAVSKTMSTENILEAYQAGQRIFGENKALELAEKHQLLPKDIKWHFIGHLQTNKVKNIAPFVTLIHSVESAKLLNVINKEGARNDRIIDCLLQFYIATEESKFGFNLEEAFTLINSEAFALLKNVRIIGVMGMATYTKSDQIIRDEFKELKNIFNNLKLHLFKNSSFFNVISMGMSGDYKIAIEEGSTMVRIGSSIFGDRNH